MHQGLPQSQWTVKGAAVLEANCRIHQMRALAHRQQRRQAFKHEAHGQQRNPTTWNGEEEAAEAVVI